MKFPWRRQRRARPPTPPGTSKAWRNDLVNRFGEICPVCAAGLGRHAVRDPASNRFLKPPSLRLEVGTPDSGNPVWRVSAIDGNFRSAVSTDPPFSKDEVDYAYLLCGDGHVFPEATPVLQHYDQDTDSGPQINTWNMVAVVGTPAGGKTYLLLRTLSQNLNNTANWAASDQDDRRLRRWKLSPLEEVTLAAWKEFYSAMLATGRRIPPSSTGAVVPAGLLEDQLREALEAIKELIRRTVMDGERRARNWGTGFRQPLVLRTESQGRQTWSGVADLPGELFLPSGRDREQVKLRAYDVLIWVIDPVVAAGALDPFAETSLTTAEASYSDVLNGSLRPGAVTADSPAEVVRTNRDHVQVEIGQHLATLGGLLTVNKGQTLDLLVTVTKCDLIHATLDKKKLTDLGEPGAVERGVAGYLALLADRSARGTLDADEPTARLLSYLHAGDAAGRRVRESRILQVAQGLLDYYSDQDNFWNLVHVGEQDVVEIPAGVGLATQPRTLSVPSIGTHLDLSLEPRAARRIHLRDLVMSALGCGVAYGLGHEAALYEILRERWLSLRFFLCSPLGTVPVALDDYRLRPLDGTARFPRLNERSAALTQLLLSILRKARG